MAGQVSFPWFFVRCLSRSRGWRAPPTPRWGSPGLPQSATGQTTLLTGENAAEAIGRHLYGYPSPTLRRMLMRASVFKRLADAGKRVAFLNAYRPLFFELGDAVWTKGMSATTWANRAGGAPFRTVDDLRAGRAVYHDITHDSAREKGYDIPPRTPEDAGDVLAHAAGEFDFVFFEFFQTDKAGHARDHARAVHELVKLDRFLTATLARMDLVRTTLLVTSDHGNVEDLSTKSHTWNPVPTLLFGEKAGALAHRLDRLEAFTPVIVATLAGTESAKTLRARVDEIHARRKRVQEALQRRLELLARIDGDGGDETAARELAALQAQTSDAELRVELLRIKREQMETEQAYYDARAGAETGHPPD